MEDLVYEFLPVNEIDLLKPLWEKLNQHHMEKTTIFKKHYEKFTFDERKRQLINDHRELKIN